MSAHRAASPRPAQDAAAEPAREAENAILVVDDEPRLRKLADLTLSAGGYQVATAASRREALAWLRTRRFALVLSDYAMPDGDGLTLLATVRRLHPGLPFVLWSAALPSPVRRRAAELGAATSDGKLVGEELSALVETVLERRNDGRPHVSVRLTRPYA